jgi:hypothetical protein
MSSDYEHINMDDSEYTDPTAPARLKTSSRLRMAQMAAANADLGNRPIDPAEEMQFALMYAAIAQAEALQRIAECLETDLDDKAARIATALEIGNHAAWGIRPTTPDEE